MPSMIIQWSMFTYMIKTHYILLDQLNHLCKLNSYVHNGKKINPPSSITATNKIIPRHQRIAVVALVTPKACQSKSYTGKLKVDFSDLSIFRQEKKTGGFDLIPFITGMLQL